MVEKSCAYSHVALLLPSIEKAAVRFASLGLSVQAPSVFMMQALGLHQVQSADQALLTVSGHKIYLKELV